MPVHASKLFLNEGTVKPLLIGHPDKRSNPLERSLDTVNLNINVLISTPDERPPLSKGHFLGVKGEASQEGFHMFICKQMCVCYCRYVYCACFHVFISMDGVGAIFLI